MYLFCVCVSGVSKREWLKQQKDQLNIHKRGGSLRKKPRVSYTEEEEPKDEDRLGDAIVYVNIHNFPPRAKCATLAWRAAGALLLGDEGDQEEAINFLIDAHRWDSKNGWA